MLGTVIIQPCSIVRDIVSEINSVHVVEWQNDRKTWNESVDNLPSARPRIVMRASINLK